MVVRLGGFCCSFLMGLGWVLVVHPWFRPLAGLGLVVHPLFHPLPGLTYFLCLAKESRQRKARPRWRP
ncbi:hypothetical protein ACNRDG_08725, partial [Ralstonia pseudosolanacearum]|uniref:hypothetical protein n=1 Tax=Ralstonia pseudosolanacearum TaxID=1310165 RepID=UPI003AAEC56A